MAQSKMLLDYLYEHEAKRADQTYLTQPTGGSGVTDYTWKQTMDQARPMKPAPTTAIRVMLGSVRAKGNCVATRRATPVAPRILLDEMETDF